MPRGKPIGEVDVQAQAQVAVAVRLFDFAVQYWGVGRERGRGFRCSGRSHCQLNFPRGQGPGGVSVRPLGI